MDFEFTEEQNLLAASVDALLSAEASPVAPKNRWSAYADLGILGMCFDEADGGLGAGPVETMVVMRAIGRHLCTSPYLASAVLGSRLFGLTASPAQKEGLAPQLIDGTARLAFGWAEPASRQNPFDIRTSAAPAEDGFLISGSKSMVLGGADATDFIVSARTAGTRFDRNGVTLFLISRNQPGLDIETFRTMDGRDAVNLRLPGIVVSEAQVLGILHEAADPIDEALAHAAVAAINEAVGLMEELLSATVDYLKTRRQFGVPIGSFQALQHKTVDMFIEVEQAKSMALFATASLGLSPATRSEAVAAAKLHVNHASKFVAESALQLHGAIGMTQESKVGPMFQRLTAFQVAFGDTDHWLSSLVSSDARILED